MVALAILNYKMNSEKSETRASIALKDLLIPSSILIMVLLTVWIFAPSMNRDGYVSVQSDIFIALNGFLNRTLAINPYVWSNITYLGNTLVALLLASLLIVYQPKAWAAILGSIPLAGIFSGVGKSMLAMPRPASVLEHDRFIIIDKVLEGFTSLPSGHTITVFCIISAVVLSFRGHKKYRQLFYGAFSLAVVFVVSRVAVGAHWPLDVVVGAVLGYVAGLSGVALVDAYSGWWSWLLKPKYKFISVLIILLFIAGLLKGEHSFTAFNGIIWFACLIGLLTITQLMVAKNK